MAGAAKKCVADREKLEQRSNRCGEDDKPDRSAVDSLGVVPFFVKLISIKFQQNLDKFLHTR